MNTAAWINYWFQYIMSLSTEEFEECLSIWVYESMPEGMQIAVQVEQNQYRMLYLYGILSNGSVIVGNREATILTLVPLSSTESVYTLLIDEDKEIIA